MLRPTPSLPINPQGTSLPRTLPRNLPNDSISPARGISLALLAHGVLSVGLCIDFEEVVDDYQNHRHGAEEVGERVEAVVGDHVVRVGTWVVRRGSWIWGPGDREEQMYEAGVVVGEKVSGGLLVVVAG